MPLIPRPTDLPLWEPLPEFVEVPLPELSENGLEDGMPLPAALVNWQWSADYLWLQYLDDVVTSVLGEAIVLTGGHAGKNKRVRYNSAGRDVVIDLGSPAVPGAPWAAAGTAGALNGVSSVGALATLHTRPGDLSLVKYYCQLPLSHGPDDADGSYSISGFTFHGYRNASATRLRISLWRQRRSNVSSPAADAQQGTDFDVTASAGIVAEYSTNPNASIGVNGAVYRYYVVVEMDASAATTEIEWHNLQCHLNVLRLEGP